MNAPVLPQRPSEAPAVTSVKRTPGPRRWRPTTCINDWCERPHHAQGYCGPCYTRGRNVGDMSRSAMRPYEVLATRRADIDEMAVTRLVDGDMPGHTTAGERWEAVRRLHALGLDDGEIATRVHLAPQSVWRIRNRELGLPANKRGRYRIASVQRRMSASTEPEVAR